MSKKKRDKALFYAYRREDGKYVMPSGILKYINHSCDANILDSGRDFDIVVSDIKKGEEATYDYRSFSDVSDQAFKCKCGKPNCCGIVRPDRSRKMRKFWEKKVKPVMKEIKNVEQPLKKQLIKKFPNLKIS